MSCLYAQRVRGRSRFLVQTWAAVCLCACAQATAQTTPTPPPPTTVAGEKAITARVLEVNGDAQQRAGEGEWKPVKANDQYPQMTQIRTGIGGSVKLQIGAEEPYTALVIDPVSVIVLSEANASPTTKKVRVGVGHGRIRAGVAEGGLKSDFTVDSPVATLSKKGTWDFGLYYERATDRFEIFLLDRGLVDALSRVTSELRELKPGEAVTQAMRRWGDEAQLRRNVALSDLLGQEDLMVAFNRLRNDGVGVTDPGGGKGSILDIRNPDASAEFRQLVQDRINTLPPVISFGDNSLRPEGFFGTGRGDELIQVIINQNSFLARNGLARPGPMTFRRSALEGYIKGH